MMEFFILMWLFGIGLVTTIIGMVTKTPLLTYLGIAIIFIATLELGTNGVEVEIGSIQDRNNTTLFNTSISYKVVQNWWTSALTNVFFIFSILAIGYHFFEDRQISPNEKV